ncbi:MAG: hypothetical protein AAFP76_08130, partial [Bacteroidota bacterium]
SIRKWLSRLVAFYHFRIEKKYSKSLLLLYFLVPFLLVLLYKYVRVDTTNDYVAAQTTRGGSSTTQKKLPQRHPSAGNSSWLFVDKIYLW